MKKQALLIGINQYQILPELKYARQDAEAVEQALKQNYGFSDNEVLLLTDAKPGLLNPSSSNIILRHLKELENQELDLFIFGFWGHGVFRSGQRYFCPSNVVDDAVEDMGFSFSQLQSVLSNIKAKNTCMILDCCQKMQDRGDLEVLTSDDQTIIENAARDIVRIRKEQIPEFRSNIAILNSCKEGQSAYEWDQRKHGIFTAHLLDAMNRRCDSVSKIVSYISDNIGKTALELGKTQTPFYKLEGDIPLPVDTKSSPLVTGDVFISYRHCNADLVAPIEEELKRRGISYFIDREGINYGMEYAEALTQAIVASKLVLLFWTPEIKGSDDIVNEVTMALKAKKVVMPYKIGAFDQFEHPRLCYHLSSLSRYEVPKQTSATVTELVNRVELALSGKAPHLPTIILPENSADGIIDKPVVDDIEDIEVPFTPEPVESTPIQTGALQLPPLPKDMLALEAENNSWQAVIDQLNTFTHESLAQANASLEQAQAQFQAWKERKEKQWENISQDLRQSLDKIISSNPECTEKDISSFTSKLSFQEYFDFIEQFQCGKKCEQAWRELERVERERQTKRDEAIVKVENKIEENNSKIKEILDRFLNEVLMTILAVMPGYDEVTTPFPESPIISPLRQLDKYKLGWSAQEILPRARDLWTNQRPCELNTHDLSIPGAIAGERKTVIVNNAEFAFRWCPAGTFIMGSPESEDERRDDEIQHQVTLTKGFWMMETPVTQKQWIAVMNENPSHFRGENRPVESISCNLCLVFCKRFTKQLGLPIQLPTEAQWEYACRAGTTGEYAGDLNEMAWYDSNSNHVTQSVKMKKPNAWGLYDMHGNVFEWCQDWYGDYPSESATDPAGPSKGSERVIRGGSYYNNKAQYCRSAARYKYAPTKRVINIGVRFVCLITSPEN